MHKTIYTPLQAFSTVLLCKVPIIEKIWVHHLQAIATNLNIPFLTNG